MLLTDTHTHLYSADFNADRDALISSAMAQNIGRFFMPNIDASSIEGMLALEERYPLHCFPMMGLHPCSVGPDFQQELETIEGWLSRKNFSAVGEIGIDLYWDKTFFSEQQQAFRTQIKLAQKYHLPFVIHSRNSFEEVMEIVDECKTTDTKAIFHCFSGSIEQAERIISSGSFKLGIGGVVTFKNSGLDKVVEAIDIKHLVLETDAPYLAPIPFRGKRNEPAYLLHVAQKVADIKKMSLAEVAAITTQNSIDVFGK